MLLATISIIGTDIDLARREKIVAVDAGNFHALAERSSEIAETTAESLGADQAAHASLAPVLGLRRSDNSTLTTVTARRVIWDSVGVSNKIVSPFASDAFATLSAKMKMHKN